MRIKSLLLGGLLLLFLAPIHSETADSSDLKADVAATKVEVQLLQQRVTELLQLRDKEISTAADAVDKRLAQMNEFRAQLDRQAGTFLTKEAYEIQRQDMTKQLQELKIYQANQEGRLWMLGAALSLFFSVFNVAAVYFVRKMHRS